MVLLYSKIDSNLKLFYTLYYVQIINKSTDSNNI